MTIAATTTTINEKKKKKERENQNSKDSDSSDSDCGTTRSGTELNDAIAKHFNKYGTHSHHELIQDYKFFTEPRCDLYTNKCKLCRKRPEILFRMKNQTHSYQVYKSASPGQRGSDGYDERYSKRQDEVLEGYD